MNSRTKNLKSLNLLTLGLFLTLASCKEGGELSNESIKGAKITDSTITPDKLDREYEESLAAGTSSQYYRGDKTWQDLITTAVAEGTNLYYTDTRARAALSASSPLSYNSTTGAFSFSLGTSNQILGINNAGSATEYKTVSGTTNQLTVTHGAGSITLSTPQDIHSAASPTFAGLTLGTMGGFVRATSGVLSASALSSSDVTTALGFTPVNRAGDTMTGTLYVPSSGLVVGTNDLFFSSGDLGIGTASPAHKLDVEKEDAATNTVTVAARVSHSTTGTPAANFGTALDLAGERSDGTLGSMARIEAKWTDPTISSEDGDLNFYSVLNGAVNLVMSLASSGNVGIGTSAAPHSVLQVEGSFATAIRSVTANYTVTDADHIILGDSSGGVITLTLPSAVGISGRQYTFKKTDASANDVSIASGQNINGSATFDQLDVQHEYITVVSDGTTWHIIAEDDITPD